MIIIEIIIIEIMMATEDKEMKGRLNNESIFKIYQ